MLILSYAKGFNMRLFFLSIIILSISACTRPVPINIGSSNYKFHVVDKKSGSDIKLFSTDIDSNSIVIVGRIKINMLDCFVESGLPLVFYNGRGGLLAVNTGGWFKQTQSNLYPYSPAMGLIAFHVPKEDVNKQFISIKGYCSAEAGTEVYKIYTKTGKFYSPQYAGTGVNYEFYELPEFIIKNPNLPYREGNIYYFGDLEYKINVENKDNPTQYQVHDNQKETYDALLKIVPEIAKLSPDIKNVSGQ